MIGELGRYIDAEGVLGYLNVPFSKADEAMICKANWAIEKIFEHAQIKHVTETFDISVSCQQISFFTSAGALSVNSSDLSAFLEHSNQAMVAAVTLGHAVSRLIKRTLVTSPSDALYLDAAASAIADATCDYLQDTWAADVEKEGKYFTGRFSPGYGDLDISTQSTFSLLVDAEKRIGCHLTSSFLLIPEKSVIFIMGSADKAYTGNTRTCSGNCSRCPLAYCRFRRLSIE